LSFADSGYRVFIAHNLTTHLHWPILTAHTIFVAKHWRFPFSIQLLPHQYYSIQMLTISQFGVIMFPTFSRRFSSRVCQKILPPRVQKRTTWWLRLVYCFCLFIGAWKHISRQCAQGQPLTVISPLRI